MTTLTLTDWELPRANIKSENRDITHHTYHRFDTRTPQLYTLTIVDNTELTVVRME